MHDKSTTDKKILYSQKRTLNSGLRYLLILPTNYKKAGLDNQIEPNIIACCFEEVTLRCTIEFLEISVEKECLIFLIESVPKHSPEFLIEAIRDAVSFGIFEKMPQIKGLDRNSFWKEGYFMQTLSSSKSGESSLTFWNDEE